MEAMTLALKSQRPVRMSVTGCARAMTSVRLGATSPHSSGGASLPSYDTIPGVSSSLQPLEASSSQELSQERCPATWPGVGWLRTPPLLPPPPSPLEKVLGQDLLSLTLTQAAT